MRQAMIGTGEPTGALPAPRAGGPPATNPERGLTEAEAAIRLAGGQGNVAAAQSSQTYRQIVRRNALTFINAVLAGLGLTLLALGHRNDAFSTVVIMALNVLVGTVQEVYAKRRLDRIALLARPTATVVRDGRERAIDPAGVVRGDLLVARAGDQLVADGPIADDGHLEMDEALLTGEADPVPKRRGDPVYAGTVCVAGAARYEARAVGAARAATRLAAGARAERRVQTPLQREIDLVIRLVLLLVAQLGLLLALAAHLQRAQLAESVQMAAVVAGLVPNGLILTITAAYAIGAVRMAGKGALVQRANAVESLSHVDTLCLDKTGTLTANRLRLVEMWPLAAADGDFRAALADYAATTSAPNRTIAAVTAALPGRRRPVRDEVPFTSGRQWSALSLDGDAGGTYVLGAPEALRPALEPDADPGEAVAWAARGWRVLLLARGPADGSLADAAGKPRLPERLVPLGLAAFGDELRPEAAATLRDFARAGVHLKLISGDHPQTVAALARQGGFPGADTAVAGADLDGLDEAALARVAEEAAVFGRVTPQQKARLVRALRRRGHYVAMVGDGVNDVLALKEAQLGVAMQSGSQAARGVADLILLRDSFAALVPALGEGQRIIGGMQDIFRLFLTRIAYETLVIVGAAVVGVPFPFVPPHIALLTLLTVGLPSFALAWWARPGPAPVGAVRALARFVLPAAWTLGALGLIVYLAHVLLGADTAVARTALTTVTLLGGLLLIPFARPPVSTGDGRRGDWRPTALAVALLGAYIGVAVTPALSRFFELAPLPAWEYALLAVAALAWGAALWQGWRARWYDRFLGLGAA